MNEENPQVSMDDLISKSKPQSEQFKRLRELLLSKIEQNDFLYSLLTDPDGFITEDKPFVFHSLTDKTVIWESQVQYITVEGAQLG
jgi:hypothetical protein